MTTAMPILCNRMPHPFASVVGPPTCRSLPCFADPGVELVCRLSHSPAPLELLQSRACTARRFWIVGRWASSSSWHCFFGEANCGGGARPGCAFAGKAATTRRSPGPGRRQPRTIGPNAPYRGRPTSTPKKQGARDRKNRLAASRDLDRKAAPPSTALTIPDLGGGWRALARARPTWCLGSPAGSSASRGSCFEWGRGVLRRSAGRPGTD